MAPEVPSRANDERFRRWIAKAQRTVGSPRVVQAYMRAVFEVDAPHLAGAHPWSCTGGTSSSPRSSTPSSWPSRSPGPNWSSFPDRRSAHLGDAAAHLGPYPGVPDRHPPGRRADPSAVNGAVQLVEEFGGRLIKTTGDGILATFDGPGRAIQCAAALRDELAGVGVGIRAGLHTGEVELRDADIVLEGRGTHRLKGVADPWQLYVVVRP